MILIRPSLIILSRKNIKRFDLKIIVIFVLNVSNSDVCYSFFDAYIPLINIGFFITAIRMERSKLC